MRAIGIGTRTNVVSRFGSRPSDVASSTVSTIATASTAAGANRKAIQTGGRGKVIPPLSTVGAGGVLTVVDGLDVVPVRVEQIRGVVGLVVLGPQSRRPVVAAAGRHAECMEVADRGAVGREERQVERPARALAGGRDREVVLAGRAERDPLVGARVGPHAPPP